MSTSIVAAVQWSPEVFDPKAAVEKAASAIGEAAAQGAQLAVFPECWLQGYPYWSGLAPSSDCYQYYRKLSFETSITRDDPVLQVVYDAARSHRCAVVLGFQERCGGTLYCSLLYISAEGERLNCQRKLVPTQAERLVWGCGDGSDIDVYNTEVGRLGGLSCFEHQMAPARMALSSLNVQVHAAAWPGHAFLDPVIDASARQLAHENACFVVVAREVMAADRLSFNDRPSEIDSGHWHATGGSAVVAPGGHYIVEPQFGKECIVTAEIDLADISVHKWFFDGTGHYARPDIFQLQWNRQPKNAVKEIDG